MNLVIDIGNSFSKAGIFEQGRIISTTLFENKGLPEGTGMNALKEWIAAYPAIRHCIISAVRREPDGLAGLLDERGIRSMRVDRDTPLPVSNRYHTPETLGMDRLAAAVGANALFPGRNLLVIDAGTAITIDFVSSRNEYRGGNISPGLGMRFRALEHFTDNLPLVRPDVQEELFGDRTEKAIRAGVQWGIIFELDGYINLQKKRYPDLEVVLTGGDAAFFDKKLKNSIFVDLNLNLHGLHRILEYNVVR